VIKDVSEKDILNMLVRHYSIFGDGVHLINMNLSTDNLFGRLIHKENFIPDLQNNNFFSSAFFKRFAIKSNKKAVTLKNIGDSNFMIYNGNASNVFRSFEENVFDAAITSPPYFNAKEYSQWPNMYCYLYDMYDINAQVFRTLKEGSLYLYNIFDYFDNEKIVALSAMGQKRMILASYTVDLFRRIGFKLLGNIVWDKGDIEGKRGFNAGNFSPYYQAPFNCWEHILVFQKPSTLPVNGIVDKVVDISKKVFECKPVFKMKGGKNTYGHSAPYPEGLPRILTKLLDKESIILDPFAGSLTTARVAEADGIRSVSIELSKEYCDLGIQKRKKLS
jgi:DNA modification methylase